tara:strand:- start:890 stop:1270 length:381 start_codon:yes stop_codon:yes gene_type:complete
MINNFLIISCIGKNDRLGLRINKDFFIHDLNKENNNEQLVSEIANFLNAHNAKLDERFSVIVNQGPGSFSGIRVSLAVAKGLEISKKIKLYGFNNRDLGVFDKENVEKLLKKNLVEKNLIKLMYLS